MKTKIWRDISLVSVLGAGFFLGNMAGTAADLYSLQKEIPISGETVSGRLSVNESARRLYVPHETGIEVVDLDKQAVVGHIDPAATVRDFAPMPKGSRGFSSNPGENKSTIVDLDTLGFVSKLDVGKDPDAVLVEPHHLEVYVFNRGDHTASVFESDDGDPEGAVDLPGVPNFAIADPDEPRIFCSIEDKDEVTVINTKTRKATGHWPTAPGHGPAGLALDRANHRLFIRCAGSLLVVNCTDGKVIATVPMSGAAGSVAFDPATRLVFCGNSDGTVNIARAETPDKITVVQTLQTRRGGRFVAIDPRTHKLFVTIADSESAANKSQDPKSAADRLKLQVYTPVTIAAGNGDLHK